MTYTGRKTQKISKNLKEAYLRIAMKAGRTVKQHLLDKIRSICWKLEKN